jgi:glycosyltransferase involved in cell wall biosynthesis
MYNIENRPGISVLISIFEKCKLEQLRLSLQSVWDDQTTKPDQIVLVIDGPVKSAVLDFLFAFKLKVGSGMRVIQLERNVGLAAALNIGLKYCSHEYIARMDSDDVSCPERFVIQLRYMEDNKEVDIVGSYIIEIDDSGEQIGTVIKYPLSHEQCRSFFAFRSPLAHPAAFFRRSFFEKTGDYPVEIRLSEDTLLWYKGFMAGCLFANIPFVTLKYRRGVDFFEKRRNFQKAIKLLWFRFYIINRKMGYGLVADGFAFSYFCIIFLPTPVLRYLYKIMR